MNKNNNTNLILKKIQTLPTCKQHCSHYSIHQDEAYEWEKDDWCITDLQNVSFEKLCNEQEVVNYINEHVNCPNCKVELLSTIHKLPTNFYDFDILNIREKLVSEDSLTLGNVYFNLEYLFTNNGMISLVPNDTSDNIISEWLPRKLDYSTLTHKLELQDLFIRLSEEFKQELDEESVMRQDKLLYDIIQILIRYIYVIQKFSNVCVFETTPPINFHDKMWKMLDLQFAMLYRHLAICLNELSSYFEPFNIPMTPLLNIHTKDYFENFKNTYGDQHELLEKVLQVKKKLNMLRMSDLQSFFDYCEKQLLKYEEHFVSLMKRTSTFHDSEEYLGSIHLSGEQSVLFVLYELTFGPMIHKKIEKIPSCSQERHSTELRACQIVISHMGTFSKQRDLLYKILIPNDFPLIPEYHKEICDTVKKIDDEWKSYESQCARQIKHEEACKVMTNYSKRTLEGITTLKCISVLRKLGTFANFLNDSKISLRSILCGPIMQPKIVYEYLEIIKKQIQFRELHNRCSKETNERILNELLTDCTSASSASASNDVKKKSKKKVTKKKEKNMNSPQDPVPENIEWISKVDIKQTSSFASLTSLCEDSSTSTSSSDENQWTHVTNAKTKNKAKVKSIQQTSTFENTNVQKQKKQNAPNKKATTMSTATTSTASTETIATTKVNSKFLSFAEALKGNNVTTVQDHQDNIDVVVNQIQENRDHQDTNDNTIVNQIQENQDTNDNNTVVNQIEENIVVQTEPVIINTNNNVNKKKKKNKTISTTTFPTLSTPPPPPPSLPPPLPTGRELTTERYLTRIPDYIHIPSYNAEQFYMTQINSNAPVVPQQQVVLVPQVIYVPQMYSSPYHVMYPTMY